MEDLGCGANIYYDNDESEDPGPARPGRLADRLEVTVRSMCLRRPGPRSNRSTLVAEIALGVSQWAGLVH